MSTKKRMKNVEKLLTVIATKVGMTDGEIGDILYPRPRYSKPETGCPAFPPTPRKIDNRKTGLALLFPDDEKSEQKYRHKCLKCEKVLVNRRSAQSCPKCKAYMESTPVVKNGYGGRKRAGAPAAAEGAKA